MSFEIEHRYPHTIGRTYQGGYMLAANVADHAQLQYARTRDQWQHRITFTLDAALAGNSIQCWTAECQVCFAEETSDRVRLCTCCGEFYCDNAEATCIERHVAHVKGERFG